MSKACQHDETRYDAPVFDLDEGEDDEMLIGDEPLAFDESLYSRPLDPRGVERELQPLLLLLFLGLALCMRVAVGGCAGDEVDASLLSDEVCAAERGAPLFTGPCVVKASPARRENRVRMALGMGLCWSSLRREELTTARGVGDVTAGRILAYRDQGGAPTASGLRSVSGVGPVTAARVVELLDPDCGRAE